GGYRRQTLFSVDAGIGSRLLSVRVASGSVSLRINAVAIAVLTVALPGDHEVDGVVHRHARNVLDVGRVRVDQKFAALGHSGGVVLPGKNAVVIAVFTVTAPGDHEIP